MTDIWLLVLIVIVGIVVAIEGIPDGFARKAKAFVMALVAAGRMMIKGVASTIIVFATRIGDRARQWRSSPDRSTKGTSPAHSLRVAIGTATAVISSPIAAIPMTFVFALLLYALNLIGGDEYSFATNGSGTLRYILGYAFVILVATLDVIFRWSAIALPSLLVLGFIAANYASRSNRYVRNLALSTLLIGGVYPLIFMLAAALNVFNDPIFN